MIGGHGMKSVYLECMSGISGNMLLGAFLQMGVPQDYLEQELKKLKLPEEYALHVEEVSRNGIHAVYLEVELPHPDTRHSHEEIHVHRTMQDIRKILGESELSLPVRKQAELIFDCLAGAEGKVHGCSREEVHFHEVGAIDSIVDITGFAICMEYLGIDKVFVSCVNTGSGYVKCAHGLMMVPAPATAELLKGFPVYHAGAEKELTTPTGAAVIAALAEYREYLPKEFGVERIAYGAGTWELEIPNVLRVYFGEYQDKREGRKYLLETNIDDMSPQIYGYLYDRLLQAGALDVWTTPVYMKKNRPAHVLTVLTEEAQRERCAEIIFTETTSIGLRVMTVEARMEAARRMERVETRYGEVHCKVSAYRGKIVSITPEYEDCRHLAELRKVPLRAVQQEALRMLQTRLGDTAGSGIGVFRITD